MYRVKARKMAAPVTGWAFRQHLSQDGRFGMSPFTSWWSVTGQMTYELVLKKISIPVQRNRWRKGSWP